MLGWVYVYYDPFAIFTTGILIAPWSLILMFVGAVMLTVILIVYVLYELWKARNNTWAILVRGLTLFIVGVWIALEGIFGRAGLITAPNSAVVILGVIILILGGYIVSTIEKA